MSKSLWVVVRASACFKVFGRTVLKKKGGTTTEQGNVVMIEFADGLDPRLCAITGRLARG
ncbi:MAG: hypothetical protein IPN96_18105 [Anaerolineales bacterium]|nr:hypothetical protein [Anaerolineales bacterium]